jgi:Tol biopolymer transport system component
MFRNSLTTIILIISPFHDAVKQPLDGYNQQIAQIMTLRRMNTRAYFQLLIYLLILNFIGIVFILLAQILGMLLHGDVVSFVSTRSGFGDIYLLDLNTRRTIQITHDRAGEEWARWSPDGQSIAYTANDRAGGLHIFVTNAYGRNIQQLTHGDEIHWFPTWSPDGTAFAATFGQGLQDTDIFILNSNDGEVQITLPDVGGQDHVTSWHGNRLLFSAGEYSRFEIYAINTDGSDLEQLTANGQYNLNAVWSPDGTQIAFQSNLNGNFDLYLMNPDGTGLRQLTFSERNEVVPMWSTDGTHIVYITVIADRQDFDIYMMNADGTDIQRLTNTPDQESSPAWMP